MDRLTTCDPVLATLSDHSRTNEKSFMVLSAGLLNCSVSNLLIFVLKEMRNLLEKRKVEELKIEKEGKKSKSGHAPISDYPKCLEPVSI